MGKFFPFVTIDDEHQETLVEAQKTSAIATLKRYNAMSKRCNPRKVEDSSLVHSRKRGREWVAASSDDFSDSEDGMESKHWSITREQKSFIDATLATEEPTKHNSDSAPPRRKRCRLDLKADFYPVVYIRHDAGIDRICGPGGA